LSPGRPLFIRASLNGRAIQAALSKREPVAVSLTLRQTMAVMLNEHKMSLRDICAALDLQPSEALSHITHLKKSLKKEFKIEPAWCRGCGFRFKQRTRLDTPGRCPQCKGQRVEGPWFSVASVKNK
jgi:predicted Zn-ribbon and HTH transcriptional regulator